MGVGDGRWRQALGTDVVGWAWETDVARQTLGTDVARRALGMDVARRALRDGRCGMGHWGWTLQDRRWSGYMQRTIHHIIAA